MEQYKPLSVIQLPEPTEKDLKAHGSDTHGNEHAKSSWRLWQIQLLLNDLAIQSPKGHRIKLSFKAESHGEKTEVTKSLTDYSRWLFRTSGSF